MLIGVNELRNLEGVPSHRTTSLDWVAARFIQTVNLPVWGGQGEHVSLSDLPAKVQRSYLQRELEHQHVAQGDFDDAAHAALMAAPPKARAERRSLIAATHAGQRSGCEARGAVRPSAAEVRKGWHFKRFFEAY